MAQESTRTVIVAMLANAGVAIAKVVAGAITGSSAMFAEAAHAIADTGNEALLLVAQRRSARPRDDDHPLGFGREAYFWALLAAVGVFVAGAVVSIREGISELLHPTPTTGYAIAYTVLLVSLLLEGLSWRTATRQLKGEASQRRRGLLEHVRLTSDPTTRAVFAEDSAAVVGNLIALVGIALHQATGSVVPDATASILIGLLLGYVAYVLGSRNKDFIVGEQAGPQARAAVTDLIVSQPGVESVRDLIVTFVGPERVWVVARVDVDDTISGRQVEALGAAVESALMAHSDVVVRADVVPRPPPGEEALEPAPGTGQAGAGAA